MNSPVELLNLNETAAFLRMSVPSVRLKLYQRRKGIGDFPETINGFNHRCFWLKSELENYVLRLNEEQNGLTPPVKDRKKKRSTT